MQIKDSWQHGEWNLNSLYMLFDNNVKSIVQEIPIPHSVNHPDCLVWLESSSSFYSASSGYKWLFLSSYSIGTGSWQCMWRLHAPFKVSFLIWLALLNCLPTNEVRFNRGLSSFLAYLRCGVGPDL